MTCPLSKLVANQHLRFPRSRYIRLHSHALPGGAAFSLLVRGFLILSDQHPFKYMTDPLSITASIAGLISFAQELITLLVGFVEDVREYPKEFRQVVEEVRSLCGILHAIRPIIERLGNQNTSPHSIASSREGIPRSFRR